MVNDEKGISDPRELIVDKGRAFITAGQGRVVAVVKGCKVYTASQTKAIMSGMGIPHYANRKRQFGRVYISQGRLDRITQKTHAVNDRTRT